APTRNLPPCSARGYHNSGSDMHLNGLAWTEVESSFATATWDAGRCRRWDHSLHDVPRRHHTTHSITSLARASSVGGTSRPSSLAVLRLITNSSLEESSIGRSPGCAPFKIRS